MGLVTVRKNGEVIDQGQNLILEGGIISFCAAFVDYQASGSSFVVDRLILGDSDEPVSFFQRHIQGNPYGGNQTPGVDWTSITVTEDTSQQGQLTLDFAYAGYIPSGNPIIREFTLHTPFSAAILALGGEGFAVARFVTSEFELESGADIDVTWVLNFTED